MLTRHFALAALFFLFSSYVLAQDSISIEKNAYHERLYFVGKAWGHVKYYHPAVASGTVDWDQALISSLPAIKSAQSDDEFHAALLALLDKAGPMTEVEEPKPTIIDSLNNNSDLSWMKDEIFSTALQNRLQEVWDKTGSMLHVKAPEDLIGRPHFFESDNYLYEGQTYPDEEARILGLFRYWNIIHYYFPYKSIMDQDWEVTLREFIPLVISASSSLEYHLAIKRLSAKIDDSHGFTYSKVLAKWYGSLYPPLEARFLGDTLVVTRVLPQAYGVETGDVIRAVDGKSIAEWIDVLKPYAAASNPETKLEVIKWMILYDNQEQMEITVWDGQTEKELTVTRNTQFRSEFLKPSNPPYYPKTAGKCRVGVIDMEQLETWMIPIMFEKFADKDALIFDIRNYPNGTLWELTDYLYESPMVYVRATIPNTRFPGLRSWVSETVGQGVQKAWEKEIVILFNQKTQSQAELTVMALEQHPKATKVGSITGAAAANVSYIYLPGNIRAAATFLGAYYPDHTPMQRVGIVPDVEVWPTVAGVRAGRDEEMETAYSVIDQSQCLTTGWGDGAAEAPTVYPNPMANALHYTLPTGFNPSAARLILYDLQGRFILEHAPTANQGTITVSDLQPGNYVLQTTHQGRRSIVHVQKQ